MILWTEADFQRVALTTKLAERTLAACRDVLVGGVSGVEAAQNWQLFPAQISRSVGILKNKQIEMLESANSLREDSNLLKHTAIQIAKCMMGDKFNVVDAVPGKSYEGPVIVNSHGFLVQKIGLSGIAHDLGDFKVVPPLNKPLEISYSSRGVSPSVSEIEFPDRRANALGRRADDRGR